MTQVTKTVLVVDDDRDILEAVGTCLEHEGYCVRCVESAAAALLAVEAHEAPDLVILDMMMAGVGGWGVLAAMVDTSRAAGRIPVLIMTALPEACAPVGRPTLRKPFGHDQLVASVRALCPVGMSIEEAPAQES
jgi:CheY-like chemotaxis protein